ncbi:hypothetical protein ACE1OC_36115 [Streptomyces sp. DSM 116496]|uniref:hypothetical protein n=1 Tax=Streptomyces stoeckheimensis TaxID=3344656 RepID=UPI0038B2DEB3
MRLQQVAGGCGGPESRVDDGRGGLSVQGDAQGVGDRAVYGGGDEGVDELQPGLVAFLGGRFLGGGRQDAGVAQPPGGVDGLLGAESGDAGGEFPGDVGAEDGAGPGEADGGGAEAVEAGDEAAAALGGREVAQERGAGFDGARPLSRTFAVSSTASKGLPVVTAQASRQNASSACSPTASRTRPETARAVSGARVSGRCPARPGSVRKASACAGSSSGR